MTFIRDLSICKWKEIIYGITKAVWSDGRIERCDNVKDVHLYLEKIDEMIHRKDNLFQERYGAW